MDSFGHTFRGAFRDTFGDTFTASLRLSKHPLAECAVAHRQLRMAIAIEASSAGSRVQVNRPDVSELRLRHIQHFVLESERLKIEQVRARAISAFGWPNTNLGRVRGGLADQ